MPCEEQAWEWTPCVSWEQRGEDAFSQLGADVRAVGRAKRQKSKGEEREGKGLLFVADFLRRGSWRSKGYGDLQESWSHVIIWKIELDSRYYRNTGPWMRQQEARCYGNRELRECRGAGVGSGCWMEGVERV